MIFLSIILITVLFLTIFMLVKEVNHFKKLSNSFLEINQLLELDNYNLKNELEKHKNKYDLMDYNFNALLRNKFLIVGNKFFLKNDPLDMIEFKEGLVGKEFEIIDIINESQHTIRCIESNVEYICEPRHVRCYNFNNCNKKLKYDFN